MSDALERRLADVDESIRVAVVDALKDASKRMECPISDLRARVHKNGIIQVRKDEDAGKRM